ncbi:unnamed protein product [Rhizophagus irregularis]|nr:unnamed protein product [Rhizophagus irregularis]CAB4436088.1 unnamed protein product [Rhizophagus irregularis]
MDNFNLNKENTLPKSIVSRKNRLRVLQELQTSDNLKEQALELKVGYKFENWEHVDQVLHTYAKTKGFSWRLQNTYHRVDGSVSKKVFECHHAGKPRSRKGNNPDITRNTTSSRIECTCYINICWPKTDSNPRVTTFEPGHKNHNLNTLTAIFAPSYRSLPESVMNRIKFYVNNSPGMGSFMIRNLLIAEFPQQTFLERDVINAIQYFKQDNSHSEVNDPDNDAFWLLEMLENQQKEDPGMFIAKKIRQGRLFHIFWMDSNQQDLYQYYHDVIVTDNTSRTNKYHMALCIFVGVDNRNHTRIFAQALLSDETSASYTWVLEQLLEANNGITPTIIISDADTGLDAALKTLLPHIKHIHCIFHIRQNLDRHMQSSLGENYRNFLSKFYSARNSLNETLFEIRWNQLIEAFPSTNNYLIGTLDKIKESWAKAFICMMSTQRVEGINAIIKKYINSQSSLVDFFQGIQSFLHNQATKAEYRDWIESLPHINISTSASQRIFPHIIKELKKYLTSELYFIQKAQLDVSLEYNATLILPEEYNSIVDAEIENNENIDSNVDDIQVDTAQISLKSLINQVNLEDILEIWHVTYLTHRSNSTPHFVILLHDQGHICTCLMILNRGLVCRHFFQVMIRSQQAQFSISLIKRRWFKLETYGNAFNDSENSSNLNVQKHAFMDVNGNLSHIDSSTILDVLRGEDSMDDINMKIQARHLYSNLFGMGRKIAQIATEKRRFDVLDVLNQVLDELYDTDESIDESDSRKILNPHMVKSKGRPRNKRFKSSVETCKNSSKATGSNAFIQDNNGHEGGSLQGKGSKTCSNCYAPNHNIRRCTAPCKLCKKEGHTYLRCKGKNVERSNSD